MAGSHQLYVYVLQQRPHVRICGFWRRRIRDGPLLTADLAQPSGIAFGVNRIYFTDSESNSVRTADADPKSGKIKTIVGKGLEDFGDLDGTLSKAFLKHPLGVAVAGSKVYVADTLNHKIPDNRSDCKDGKHVMGLWQTWKCSGRVSAI